MPMVTSSVNQSASTIDATKKPEPMKAEALPPIGDVPEPQRAPNDPPVPPAPKAVAAPPTPAPKAPTKFVTWDGSWSGIKPTQKDLNFGSIVAKQSKNELGNFYLDAKNGKAAFFPNPETYPKGGYFAGEAVPIG
jgi:hypothetical protein